MKIFGILAISTLIAFSLISCTDEPKPSPEKPVDTPEAPPELTGTVKVEGKACIGDTLTANTEEVSGSGAVSYQWRLDGEAISGTNNESLFLRSAYEGAAVSVRVIRAGYSGELVSEPTGAVIRPVSGISGVPAFATAGSPLLLTGTAIPSNATNKTITWSVFDPGTTGATITDGNILNAREEGTVTINAAIANGPAHGTDYTENFSITVIAAGSFDQWITRINFTGQTAEVNLNNLFNHDIYLVKVNTSAFEAMAGGTGSVSNTAPVLSVIPPDFIPAALPVRGRPHDENNRFPLPPSGGNVSIRRLFSFVPPSVGDTRNFWVESSFGSNTFESRQATLLATGNYSNIWVINNSINTNQARALSDRFDIIYPATTNIFGHEYGKNEGDTYGGVDGDPKIQILVYNIGLNIAGFFWAKDHYGDPVSGLRSNQAEIFYIDASLIRERPLYAYDTLTHELQHMIHFNVKEIEKNLPSSTWYNEMMSMIAQDIISDLIGIQTTDRDHVIAYMPIFLANYAAEGLSQWGGSYNAYATKYAFGAYLVRNYGGAGFVQNLSANNFTDIQSIEAALEKAEAGLTFTEALIRFSEAMVYSDKRPNGANTFNRTARNTINGFTYTAHGFNIWNIKRPETTQTGPVIYDLNQRSIKPYSVTVHSADAWKNKYGSFTVTLQKPVNDNVVFVLIVKER